MLLVDDIADQSINQGRTMLGESLRERAEAEFGIVDKQVWGSVSVY